MLGIDNLLHTIVLTLLFFSILFIKMYFTWLSFVLSYLYILSFVCTNHTIGSITIFCTAVEQVAIVNKTKKLWNIKKRITKLWIDIQYDFYFVLFWFDKLLMTMKNRERWCMVLSIKTYLESSNRWLRKKMCT